MIFLVVVWIVELHERKEGGDKRTACAVAYYRTKGDGEEDRDGWVVEDGFREGEVRDVGCHCCGQW